MIICDKNVDGDSKNFWTLQWDGDSGNPLSVENIRIFLDDNNRTIEPSFVAANKDKLHDLSSTVRKKRNSNETTDTLIDFMSNNKTEWAYRLIQGSKQFEVPQYIKDAFEWIDGK